MDSGARLSTPCWRAPGSEIGDEIQMAQPPFHQWPDQAQPDRNLNPMGGLPIMISETGAAGRAADSTWQPG